MIRLYSSMGDSCVSESVDSAHFSHRSRMVSTGSGGDTRIEFRVSPKEGVQGGDLQGLSPTSFHEGRH